MPPKAYRRHSYPSGDAKQTLECAYHQIDNPKTIRADQRTESMSCDLDLWVYSKGMIPDFSRPGSPTDSIFIEAINGGMEQRLQ